MGEDEVLATKRNLGWPYDKPFTVPEEALAALRRSLDAGYEAQRQWSEALSAYSTAHPGLAVEFRRMLAGELPAGWPEALPTFQAGEQHHPSAAETTVLSLL